MFRIGQKVVCVNDRAMTAQRPIGDFIKKGQIYLVREMCEFDYPPDRQFGIAVRLVGIVRDGGILWPDYPFSAVRFRPLIERKTDISIFTAMLKPENIDA